MKRTVLAWGVWLAGLCIPAWAQTETERFDIDRFQVEGNTLLPPQEIEGLLRPFTGPRREYGDVQRALEALEFRYRERGYAAVRIFVPEQELGTGVIRISVIEASIRRVQIEGATFYDAANIRRSLPAVREGSFPNAVTMSSNVQLANENPAKQVEVILRGADEEGLIDAEVKVTDSNPLKLSLTLDNTGNQQTGQHRVGVGMQHANVLDRDHVLSLNYITAPEKPDQVSIYSLGYRVPLYALGDSIDVIAAKSDVDAGTTQTVAGPLAFAGKGDIYGFRYNYLLPRRGEYSHRLVFGLDLKAFQNTCAIGGAAVCGASGVDVTVRPLSVTYAGLWARPGGQTDYSLTFAQNWPGAGHGNSADVAAARPSPAGGPGAPARFTAIRGAASHLRALSDDWQVRGAFSGQYGHQPLISGEQFSIAGATAVRGFAEREVARDNGYFGNLEIYTPNLASRLGSESSNVRALAFYDFGFAVNNPLPGESKQKASIASAGIGVRWTWQKSLSLRSDFAQVVDEGGTKVRGARRLQFALYYAF